MYKKLLFFKLEILFQKCTRKYSIQKILHFPPIKVFFRCTCTIILISLRTNIFSKQSSLKVFHHYNPSAKRVIQVSLNVSK